MCRVALYGHLTGSGPFPPGTEHVILNGHVELDQGLPTLGVADNGNLGTHKCH